MSDAKIPRILIVLLVLSASVHFLTLYPQLPERMASHFSVTGVPNGWMSKTSFFVLFPVIAIVLIVVSVAVPKTIAVLSPEYVNLPNKEYWLAPERRAGTAKYLEGALTWFACMLLVLLLFGMYSAILANLHPDRGFNSTFFLAGLGFFAAFLIAWLIRLFAHFGRPR